MIWYDMIWHDMIWYDIMYVRVWCPPPAIWVGPINFQESDCCTSDFSGESVSWMSWRLRTFLVASFGYGTDEFLVHHGSSSNKNHIVNLEGLDCKWSKSNLQRLRFVVYNLYPTIQYTWYTRFIQVFIYPRWCRISSINGGTSSPSSSCMPPRCQDLGMSEHSPKTWQHVGTHGFLPWHHSETFFSVFR